jgi:hypothetical protein
MVKIYKILLLAVILALATTVVNAQNGTKDNSLAKMPVTNGVDARNYTINDLDYSGWCGRRTIRFSTNSILNPSDVNVNHFSFGNRPGEGVESVTYIGFENNQHVYQLVSTPRNTPVEGFFHSPSSNFTNNFDFFTLPASGGLEAIPGVSIIDANTVQIPTYLQLEILEYRWLRNGEYYTTTTNPIFNITEPGSYTVQLVLASGCVTLPSGSITFVTDITGRIIKDCQVYPSPAKSFINVDGIDFRDGDVIAISTIDGKQMLTRAMKLGETNVAINIQDLNKGIYFLSVYRGSIPYAYKRFLKN